MSMCKTNWHALSTMSGYWITISSICCMTFNSCPYGTGLLLRWQVYATLHLDSNNWLICMKTPSVRPSLHAPSWTLRSSGQNLLATPRSSTKTAARRFSSSAPAVWKNLQSDVRDCDSVVTFKSHLKTYLFCWKLQVHLNLLTDGP